MNANEDFFEDAVCGSKNSELESDFQALTLETGHPLERPIYRLQYSLEGQRNPTPFDDEDDDDPPAIWSVNFSPSGQSIASGGEGIIEVWDAAGKLESKLLLYANNVGSIYEIHWSNDGNLLLSSGFGLKMWNVNTGECVKTIRDHEIFTCIAKFSPDDSLILSGGDDTMARIWDAKSGQCLHRLMGYYGAVNSVDFHRDGTRFMTTSRYGCCYERDLRSMEIVDDLTTEDRPIQSAKYSPDCRYILLSMRDFSLRLFDVRKQKVVGIYKGYLNDRTRCGNFLLTTSGKYIVAGSFDNLVYVWDVNTQEIVQELEGHSEKVVGVACHPENDTIVSGSHDNSIKIWKCS